MVAAAAADNPAMPTDRPLRLLAFDTSTERMSVALAAAGHGVQPAQIAKTLSLRVRDRNLLVVTSGEARLDNKKAKAVFGGKPRMLTAEEVVAITGHPVGGVCPFGLPAPLTIYCDVSLKIYGEVIPAGGSTHASVRLPLARLVELCGGQWADACDVPA